MTPTALPLRLESGRVFSRTLLGYETEAEALAESKRLWRAGYAVRVERAGGLWYVWRG